nr:SDR family NAD(P)-dependent oxidoreductase [Kineosporia babensis]
MPASLNSRPANPGLQLARSPFHVLDTTRPWEGPPLAGVSSFGIGGTNCHVLLGPAPETATTPVTPQPRPQVMMVSAASAPAAVATAERLRTWSDDPAAPEPADIAHTLAHGRAQLPHRVTIVGDQPPAPPVHAASSAPRVIFAFPGAGGHHAQMGATLYRTEPVFAASVDETAELLKPLIGADVRDSFTSSEPFWVRDVARAVPVIHAVSVGVAALLQHWGVKPDVMIGHSLGECSAAVVSGALSPADGARLVAARCTAAGRSAGGGAMLAVELDEAEVLERLARHPELDLAAVNAPGSSLVSGPMAEITALADELTGLQIRATLLRLDAAMHSRRVDPALPEVRAALTGLTGSDPAVPLISTVTGQPADGATLGDPEHWVAQLRSTVLFSAALRAAVTGPSVLVEVGPGGSLSGLAARHKLAGVRATLLTVDEEEPAEITVRHALGQLWAHGVPVQPGVLTGPGRRRVQVPGYAFQRRRAWIDPPSTQQPDDERVTPDEPLQLPLWRPVAPLRRVTPSGRWTVAGNSELALGLRAQLAAGSSEDGLAGVIVVNDQAPDGTDASVLDAVTAFTQAVAPGDDSPTAVLLVTRGGEQVASDPAPAPATAAIRVLPRVLGQERPGLRWASLDLALDGTVEHEIGAVLAHAAALADDPAPAGTENALRGRTRWQRTLVSWQPELPALPVAPLEEPQALVIGGRGAVGRLIAAHFAERGYQVAVTTRGGQRGDLAETPAHPAVTEYRLDATDAEGTRELLGRLSAGGRLKVVVYAAGVVEGASLDRLDALEAQQLAAHLSVKLGGARVLREAISALPAQDRPQTVLLMSSATTLLGGLGIGGYAAANAAMGALAAAPDASTNWCSVLWDAWSVAGGPLVTTGALDAQTGLPALERLLAASTAGELPSTVAVATSDLTPRIAQASRPREAGTTSSISGSTNGDQVQQVVTALWSELFGTPVTDDEDDFFALGGHSLLGTRMLVSLEEQLGVRLGLRDLLAAPTVAAFTERLRASGAQQHSPEPEFVVPEVVLAPDGSFPMTRVQHAYWVGREGGHRFGGVPCHFYLEYDCPDLDVARYARAWDTVIARHPMLRSVTTPEGRMRTLERVRPLRIRTFDLTQSSEGKRDERLAQMREQVAHRPGPSDSWPLVQMQAARLPGGRVRLAIGVDVLICDASSWWIIEAELRRCYEEPGVELPELTLHPASCVAALEARRSGPAGQRAAQYWRSRYDTLPAAPRLPVTEPTGAPRFRRIATRLSKDEWSQLVTAAAAHRVTPTAVLLTVYNDVLADWSGHRGFCVTLTLFDRPAIHPQVNQVVGDFTSLLLHEVPANAPASFLERARATQDQLFADLDHREFSALEVLSERARRTGSQHSVPVVFTGALGVHDQLEDSGSLEWVGEQVHAVGQTPQTWLDHQVLEQAGELRLQWDFVDGAFPEPALQDMVSQHTQRVRGLAADPGAWTVGAPSAPSAPLPVTGADLVLPLRAEASPQAPTLYLVHPSGGDVLCYVDLARSLNTDVNVAALADPVLTGALDEGATTVPAIAAQYIAALRDSGARSPWLLGGWSMGGTLAQEMARQLQADGDVVSALIMLDSNDPTHITAVPGADADQVSRAVTLRHLHALEAFLDIDLDSGPEAVRELSRLSRPEWEQAVSARLRGHRLLGRNESLDARVGVFGRHLQALAAHLPGRLADPRTQTLLIRADQPSPRNSGIGMGVDDTPRERLADLGWGAHLAGPLQVHGVDTHHYGMLRPPVLATVVTLVDELLSKHLADR